MAHDSEPQVADLTRRQLVIAGSGLVTLISARGAACAEIETDDESKHVLKSGERATLSALGDALLPGASEAGIVRYVERQLNSQTPLLFLRYMDYPSSCLAFYRDGLKALNARSLSLYGANFPKLSAEQQADLLSSLSQQNPSDWDGPPAPLFYFVTRNDALDVCYGTIEGFQKLDIPYLALIPPPRKW